MRGGAAFPVRIRFAKRGPIRFVGHRDVARLFERAFRITSLPLAFTEGFSPRPKVSFGLALSLGHESNAEYLDVELREPVDLDALGPALSDALPEGIDVIGVGRLAERAPALQEAVTLVEWRIEVRTDADLTAAVSAALAADALAVERTRKGRVSVDDIRPAVVAISSPEPGVICAELATHPVSCRPEELIQALANVAGESITSVRTFRIQQWIERDGARCEPLDADVWSDALAPAEVLAS
ncbi:MAG: TIGR03936 family radical SAM-associated protein [Acidimicrobiia bacterium]